MTAEETYTTIEAIIPGHQDLATVKETMRAEGRAGNVWAGYGMDATQGGRVTHATADCEDREAVVVTNSVLTAYRGTRVREIRKKK